MHDPNLHTTLDATFQSIREAREAFTPSLQAREVGHVSNVATGIARVTGLPNVGFEELVKFLAGCTALPLTSAKPTLAWYC